MSDRLRQCNDEFTERVARLIGTTTYRVPVGGRGSSSDHVPDAHAVAAALAYARMGPNDIGPDIAVSIVTGSMAHSTRVIVDLAAALLIALGRRTGAEADAIVEIARDCWHRVVTGVGIGKPAGMGDRPYEIASAIGDRILWRAAEESLYRAERAYRSS